MTDVEAFSLPPAGDPKRDRLVFTRALGQVWQENYGAGFMDALMSDEEWLATYDDRLRTHWRQDLPPHPSWVPLLRETIENGPFGENLWTVEHWRDGLIALIAEWLLRGPESILPLMSELACPGREPELIFMALQSYFFHGPYPLTPKIEELLTKSVARIGAYNDPSAAWLIETVDAAKLWPLLHGIDDQLPEAYAKARLSLVNTGDKDD